MKINHVLVPALAALLAGACGQEPTTTKKSSTRSGTNLTQEEERPQPGELEEIDGTYLAVLVPLNVLVAGQVKGAFTLSREQDELVGDVRLTGGGPSLLHAQNVHIGSTCPIQKDDTNNDGFIDYVEGSKVFGDVLVPLDGDVNTQELGAGFFPVADKYGNYIYSEVASYQQFLQDLKDPDPNPADLVVKLGPEEKADMVGKVVVIQGVPAETRLPPTVQSVGGFANFQTLPIACGRITKVAETPGTAGGSRGTTTGGSGGDDGATVRPPGHTTGGVAGGGETEGMEETGGGVVP